ncbi:MAG TPA: ABC transporter permease [Caldisericia bacterium]|nr:ABC transporter permease [Caldisericia bacterium]HOL82461.1 ABC transporter permease [Caldisericia bacterium]HON83306.1 ABC transporter permease [Caldisericia bacterium]HPC56674.1 ABC transporter permease [Caldisericia bacterium]HPP43404.1 ABC transporter permease [Caldisericia bacterium]
MKDKKILRVILIYFLSILFAFLVISIIVSIFGYNVIKVLKTLLTTSFKTTFGFQETIKKTIPLIFTTYAYTIPFMIKFFNIGGWGQMLFGGTITAVVGLTLPYLGINFPSYIMIPLLIVTGILAGGFFGLIAGFLAAKFDINPIISTIMLNFVAVQFLNFIATNPIYRDPFEGHPITLPLPKSGTLGFIYGVPVSIIFAIISIIFVYVLIKKTKLGYEITAIGHNLDAAQKFGINFQKTILTTFFIAGALAGLGGTFEVINIHKKLIEGFAQTSGAQYGIFGVLTGLIVAGDPVGVPIAAFLMSVLLVGADALQRTMQIPVEMVFLSQALIVLFIVTFRERFLRRT